MQFSTALVAIFASVAFAAGPVSVSAGASAKPTGVTDAAKGLPDGLKQCVAKCADQKDAVSEAVMCLKKNCAKELGSVTVGAGAGASGAASADGADADAGGKAGKADKKGPSPTGLQKCAAKCADKKEALDKALTCLKKSCAGALKSQTAGAGATATAGAGVDAEGLVNGI